MGDQFELSDSLPVIADGSETPETTNHAKILIPVVALLALGGVSAAAFIAAERLGPLASSGTLPDELKALSGFAYEGARKVASISLAIHDLGQRLRHGTPPGPASTEIVPDIDE